VTSVVDLPRGRRPGRLQELPHAVEEASGVGVHLEDKTSGREHPLENLFSLGQDSEDLRSGPRNMPEEGHRGREGFFDQSGQQGEMKIVDPHDALFLPELIDDRAGEVSIERDIAIPALPLVDDPVECLWHSGHNTSFA
jgi:hypothetical protein